MSLRPLAIGSLIGLLSLGMFDVAPEPMPYRRSSRSGGSTRSEKEDARRKRLRKISEKSRKRNRK